MNKVFLAKSTNQKPSVPHLLSIRILLCTCTYVDGVAVSEVTDARTHAQTEYCNPRCACVPRVNKCSTFRPTMSEVDFGREYHTISEKYVLITQAHIWIAKDCRILPLYSIMIVTKSVGSVYGLQVCAGHHIDRRSLSSLEFSRFR